MGDTIRLESPYQYTGNIPDPSARVFNPLKFALSHEEEEEP